MSDWSNEETNEPLIADHRNFYKVEQWSRDGQRVERMLFAGNSLDRPEKYSRPRFAADRVAATRSGRSDEVLLARYRLVRIDHAHLEPIEDLQRLLSSFFRSGVGSLRQALLSPALPRRCHVHAQARVRSRKEASKRSPY
jgi:hypothetical protein